MEYIVVFLDDGGRIFSAERIEAPDDGGAIDRARALFRCGIGHSYEIRQDDRRVHTERVQSAQTVSGSQESAQPQRWANEHLARAAECQRLAAAAADPVLREHLLSLRRKCLSAAVESGRHGTAVSCSMRLHMADGEDLKDRLEAQSEEEALQIAAVLFDACSDVSVGYEVWRDGKRIDGQSCSAACPSPSQLRAAAQQIVLDREITLRDSHAAVASSRRLLDRTEAWMSAIRS